MKKILMTVVMLVMILPTFGQKLNSRGEKMVSSICCYRDGKAYGLTNFEYNKDGSLHVISNKTGKIEYDKGKFTIVGWKLDSQAPTYEVTTDPSNRIICVKRFTKLIGEKGISFDLYNLEYGYCKELNKDVLLSYNSSIWYQEGKGQPYMDRSHEYNCTEYTYSKSGPQKTMYVRSDRMATDFIFYKNLITYGDAINDTNINIPILFWSNAISDEISMLSLTEWCPLCSPYLPIETSRGGCVAGFYEYDYYEGNIVGIRVYQKCTGKLMYAYKINYVED